MHDFQEPQEARVTDFNMVFAQGSPDIWAGLGVNARVDTLADFRLARMDFGPSPQTFRPPGPRTEMPGPGQADQYRPQSINFTNPYGPGNLQHWQDQSQDEEEYDGADLQEPEVQNRTAERAEDRDRPVITVRAGESIQRALERAPEGAIINVEAGVYRERLNITRDNISLRGQPGAIFDYQNVSIQGAAIKINGRQNVTIEGFEIKNIAGSQTPTAIQVEGASSNIRIVNNHIHDVQNGSNAHAIAVYGRGNTPIRNIEISGNRIHDLKLGQSEAVVINGNVDGFRITHNNIYNSDNIAIDIIGGEGVGRTADYARNGLIAHNTVANVDSGRNPTYRTACAAGIYVDGGRDIVIEHNQVSNSNFGIEVASEKRGMYAERITVRHNRLTNNQIAGIVIGGSGPSNGGIKDSVVENNYIAGTRQAIARQRNISSVTVRDNGDA